MVKEDAKKLIEKSEISLSLDSYDDIFSDFDPRPYSQRALSDDFLIEAKKASRDKGTGIELNFLIPKEKRSLYEENVIRGRLKEHFRKHHSMLHSEKNSIMKQGFAFILGGIILMLLATYVLFRFNESTFWASLMIIILEPGGWYLLWEGLNLMIFESKKKNPDLEFYEKMITAEINFFSY